MVQCFIKASYILKKSWVCAIPLLRGVEGCVDHAE